MPKDYKKMYLEEQTNKLKQDLELANLRKEIEDFKRNQLLIQQQQLLQPPQQTNTQFENDVKYIVDLSQRMAGLLREIRRQMLPMEIGKKIDVVLREIDRL